MAGEGQEMVDRKVVECERNLCRMASIMSSSR